MRYPSTFRYVMSGESSRVPSLSKVSMFNAANLGISPLIHIMSRQPSLGRAAGKKLASVAMNAICAMLVL